MGFFSQLGNMMRVLFTPITVIKSCSHLGQQCKCEQQYVGLVSTWVLLKNFYRSLVLLLGPGLISMKHELPPSLPANGKGVLTLVLCLVRRPPWQWLHKFEPTRNWNLDSNLQLGWNLWDTPAKVNETTQVHSHLEEWMVMSKWETLSGSIPKP
jgi:hypothetical protein